MSWLGNDLKIFQQLQRMELEILHVDSLQWEVGAHFIVFDFFKEIANKTNH